MSEDWRKRALCRKFDPESFFPTATTGFFYERQVAEAKAVCARCPVLDPCRSWAINVLADGVAGGLSADERRAARENGGHLPLVETPKSVGFTPVERAEAGRAAARRGTPLRLLMADFGVSERTAARWVAQVRGEVGVSA